MAGKYSTARITVKGKGADGKEVAIPTGFEWCHTAPNSLGLYQIIIRSESDHSLSAPIKGLYAKHVGPSVFKFIANNRISDGALLPKPSEVYGFNSDGAPTGAGAGFTMSEGLQGLQDSGRGPKWDYSKVCKKSASAGSRDKGADGAPIVDF
jgi:hypothetical protein